MCDYCTCHEIEPVRTLALEHELLDTLSDRLSRSLAARDADAARTVHRELAAALRVHNAHEEPLYAALRDAGEVALADRFAAEHAVIEDGLLGDCDDATRLEALRLLREHIFMEEHDLFPALVLLLDEAQWRRAAPVAAAPRRA